MNLGNQSSKSEEHKTKELEKQVENLKKIIELQNKTAEHDRKLQRNFRYEMM
jgi:predicted metallo-beta-lactamase superfamily hydrolase